MANSLAIRTAFWLYNLGWQAAIPALRLNSRLRDGIASRLVTDPLTKADIWIQAASGGEAYLAWEIIDQLTTRTPWQLLLTTNTRQGLEILDKAAGQLSAANTPLSATTRFCPFDQPVLMETAMQAVRPKMLVLLESEIWPGLMRAAHRIGCRTVIVNGRMTERSLKRYLIWPSFWRENRPVCILAISDDDAARFARLFGQHCVSVMPNIKFDRLRFDHSADTDNSDLDRIIPPHRPFVVLGSIRKEEEADVEQILTKLHRRAPHAVVGLFPRHMHRLRIWQHILKRIGLPWVSRTDVTGPIHDESVILWDTFGELGSAYRCAATAFIGGSLAPLGGQNFLEALLWGVVPVIGPYWDNFVWVGQALFEQKLVKQATDWNEAADMLIAGLKAPPPRADICKAAHRYISGRQGGTAAACRLIEEMMAESSVVSHK